MPTSAEQLRFDILPEPQRRLWPALSCVPEPFVLFGGTAIALQLGHRRSVDFDFFAFEDIDTHALLMELPILRAASVQRLAPNTLTALVETTDGPVQISFFGLPRLRGLSDPLKAANGVRVARLLDLAGMKMAAVQHRAEAKDYLDIDAILRRTDIALEQAVAAAGVIYGAQFNPYDTLKALSHFGEEGLRTLPDSLKGRLRDAVRRFDHEALERLHEEYERMASGGTNG